MLFLLKTSVTVNSDRLTFRCFCGNTTLPYYKCPIPYHKKSEHKSKVGIDMFFHLDVLKVSCNTVHFYLAYSTFA